MLRIVPLSPDSPVRSRQRPIAFAVRHLVVAACCFVAAGASAEERIDFDAKVAPILSRHCLECHGGATQEGKLDLSQKSTAYTGESGDALVGGDPDGSLVWQYVESDEMPKDRPPLSDEEKETLRTWIEEGARWGGNSTDPLAQTTDRRAGYDWRFLQPIKQPAPPAVKKSEWTRNGVDRFTLATLEEKGLAPAPEADRRTLIRRLSFDLTGLPPDPADVERFVADDSPDAYERLVERLLASPRYGERWARHWLDVVRFGESQGFERNHIRENAWRYRDWTVGAFNRDLPYDEFVKRQIAGDVLYPGDFDALVATGYHVVGTWDQVGHLEGSPTMRVAARWDHLEDLVGTFGQAYLGLTVNCARCHDHKFDPIAQEDYYRVAALLGGVHQEKDERNVGSLALDPEGLAEIQKQLKPAREEVAKLERQLSEKYAKEASATVDPALLALYRFESDAPGSVADLSEGGAPLATGDAKPRYATAAPPEKFIAAAKRANAFTLEAWLEPANAKQSGPARIVTLSVDSGRRNFTLGQEGDKLDVRLRTTKTDGNGLPSLASPGGALKTRRTHVAFVFDAGVGRLYVDGAQVAEKRFDGDLSNWDDSFRLGFGDEFSGGRKWEGKYGFVALYARALSAEEIERNFGSESKSVGGGESIEALLARASKEERTAFEKARQRRNDLQARAERLTLSGKLHVPALKQPDVFHVLARGDYRTPTKKVVPSGLSALAHVGLSDNFGLPENAPEAQRRAKLAEWLVDPRNPLTARVFVNRVWGYHFGRAIVATPSDFGFNGAEPSHPELLDWLTSRFRDDGWNVKDLHRLIVTSATYRQASNVRNEEAQKVDPGNELLWRFRSRPLGGEEVRDASLLVAGALNLRIGGESYRDVKINLAANTEFTTPTGEFAPAVNRRTIYRLWARSGNHPLLLSLDCPEPSVMAPVRSKTVTPLQALSLFNDPAVEKCGEAFAERIRKQAGDDAARQVEAAYRIAFARDPSPDEAKLAREFISEGGLAQFCLTLFNTNEFLHVD
jgi:hypothetical protein